MKKTRVVLFCALLLASVFLSIKSFHLSPGVAFAADAGVSERPVAEGAKPISAFGPALQIKAGDYPRISGVNPRLGVWFAAQMHLWFAAFVLAVPIFVFIIELAGVVKKDERYDRMAYEFIRVSLVAYSITAITGGILLFALIVFYPDLMRYLASIFGPSMLLYAGLFFMESACLYVYYYGWNRMKSGGLKKLHLGVGLLLNLSGTALMFIANAWVTFMMSPSGVDRAGVFDGNLWHAVHNVLWMPMNIHRFIANVSYGASIVGAYAAYCFLSAREGREKAHYDWMGYTASLISIAALLPLPFAGYWLTAEIYAYSQQMGITLMGGSFGWLFIIQAVVIGALFLSANYYLWCGMLRCDGGRRYLGHVKYIACVLFVCFLVWFTPHTLVLTPVETKALGGQYHPLLGPLGLMPAKNTAVNVMLIFTYLSYLLYRRAPRAPVVKWAASADAIQWALFSAGIANIIFLGVYYGYFTNTVYKVSSSVAQVTTTVVVILISAIIEWRLHRGAIRAEAFGWGRMPVRSQYALFLLAVSFTWLMGLMGYVRSAIRGRWHVYGVMKDTSPDAFTPAIGYAAKVVSVGTLLFMAVIVFIFWLSRLTNAKGGGHE